MGDCQSYVAKRFGGRPSDGGWSEARAFCTLLTSSSAMAERPHKAQYVFDYRPTLFAKPCTKLHFLRHPVGQSGAI